MCHNAVCQSAPRLLPANTVHASRHGFPHFLQENTSNVMKISFSKSNLLSKRLHCQGKDKVVPVNVVKGCRKIGVKLHLFLTSALHWRRGALIASQPGRFAPYGASSVYPPNENLDGCQSRYGRFREQKNRSSLH